MQLDERIQLFHHQRITPWAQHARQGEPRCALSSLEVQLDQRIQLSHHPRITPWVQPTHTCRECAYLPTTPGHEHGDSARTARAATSWSSARTTTLQAGSRCRHKAEVAGWRDPPTQLHSLIQKAQSTSGFALHFANPPSSAGCCCLLRSAYVLQSSEARRLKGPTSLHAHAYIHAYTYTYTYTYTPTPTCRECAYLPTME